METGSFQIGADGELIFDTDYLNDTAKIIPVEEKRTPFWRKRWFHLLLFTIVSQMILMILACSVVTMLISLFIFSW